MSIHELLDHFDADLENDFENNAWKLGHNVQESQEILNKIMQRIMSIVTSALTPGCSLAILIMHAHLLETSSISGYHALLSVSMDYDCTRTVSLFMK